MFSDKLRNLMIRKNIKKHELADMLDVSEISVEKWLTGEVDPTIKLKKLSKVLNCSLDYLVGNTRYNTIHLSNDIYAELNYYQSKVELLKREIKNREKRFGFLTLTEMDFSYLEDNSYIEKLQRRIESKDYFFLKSSLRNFENKFTRRR